MAIGRGDGVEAPGVGMSDHVQKLGIDVGLALKIKDEVEQLVMELVDGGLKEV